MYSTRTGLIVAFHGCDDSIVNKIVLNQTQLKPSTNDYDWLGHGVYFWENNLRRAQEYAEELQNRRTSNKPKIEQPAVIGAVINLGNCLDLLDSNNLHLLETVYYKLASKYKELPKNKFIGNNIDLLQRFLDCLVIETLHEEIKEAKLPEFDSVRGVFFEGEPLYEGAGFRKKDHIQICIRNPNCIKGYFLPKSLDTRFPKV